MKYNREDLPHRLSALPTARYDLNRRIHELQTDDADTIESLVGVTSQISSGAIPRLSAEDATMKVSDILVQLDNRRQYVLQLLEKYLAEDKALRDLQVAVDQLPPDQRMLVKKSYFEMRTSKELEAEYGTDRTTIYRKKQAALDLIYNNLMEAENHD